MENITIPAWFVAINLFLAGFMWLVTRNTRIRIDSRIWGNTMVCIGILYMLSYTNTNPSEIDMASRVTGSRLVVSIMAFSQWFPLLISYVRSLNATRKVIDGLARNNHNTNRDS